jgi:hypothetical protein
MSGMTQETLKNAVMPVSKKGRPRVYPFQDMEVGDCFTITDASDPRTDGRVRASACNYGKRASKKFSVNRVDECLHVRRVA